jgi:hypothetical protein
MAPLPPNSTPRLFLDYTSMGIPHTLMVRLPAAAALPEVEGFAFALGSVLVTRMLEGDSVLSARYSNAGSSFSFPINFDPNPGILTNAGNIWGQDPESTFISVVGRSAVSGRKSRVEFFTPVTTTSWPSDNRYNPGESAPIDTFRLNLLNVLNGISTGGLAAVTIDGTDVFYNPYVNIAQNAYWQRKQRRTG